MPRSQSDNTFQVAFKIPDEWVAIADKIAKKRTKPDVIVTRTEILRSALYQGLKGMKP